MTLNKKPISWHEQNLKNFEASYLRDLKELENKKNEVDRMKKELDKRKYQISLTKKLNLESYDEQESKMNKGVQNVKKYNNY